MFYTVFSTDDCAYMQWQSELLEYSWKRVEQPGQLVRLVATHNPDHLPEHQHARTVATQPWNIHPESGDAYAIYNKPASLLEWLYKDQPEGTVLFVDPDCVFRRKITQQVVPGSPVSQGWVDHQLTNASKRTPFGLKPEFGFLANHCANVKIPGDSVMIPTLIHTSDLKKICARWLELCAVVRDHYRDVNDLPAWESDMFAYVAACAEYNLEHKKMDLGICTNWDADAMPDSPMIHYCQAIKDINGRTIFNKHNYKPWTLIDETVEPEFYYGKDLAALINEFTFNLSGAIQPVSLDASPERLKGVMEGRVLDDLLLEIPDQNKSTWLNFSGKSIWDRCDGNITVNDIAQSIKDEFEIDLKMAAEQTSMLVGQLKQMGFLKLH